MARAALTHRIKKIWKVGLCAMVTVSFFSCGPGLCPFSQTYCGIPVTISNLKNNSEVLTGYVVGTSGGTVVGYQLDSGPLQTATGTSSWKFALPIGAATWKAGSRHTITVGALS